MTHIPVESEGRMIMMPIDAIQRLTRRDLFAAHALQTLVNLELTKTVYTPQPVEFARVAAMATQFADALIKELDKK